MAEYRAYTVGVDGHFVGFEPLTCADDAEAIEKGKRLVDGQDIELWSGPGLVIRIRPAKSIPLNAEPATARERLRTPTEAASFIPDGANVSATAPCRSRAPPA